jgi:hypothetical protein
MFKKNEVFFLGEHKTRVGPIVFRSYVYRPELGAKG